MPLNCTTVCRPLAVKKLPTMPRFVPLMMTVPPDGGDMTEVGVTHLRQRLTECGWDWLPEIAGLKHPGKEHGDWREKCGTFDWRVPYSNRYGLLLNTALYANDLFIFDFDVDDPDAAEARVLAAGATKLDFEPNDHWRVYADPAGHPFCLCTEDPPGQATSL